ncbi:MAG: alpha-mannosidase [Phycisphaerales bacterium]
MSLSHIEFQLKRFEAFERGVIAPAVFRTVAPLRVEAARTDQDLKPSQTASLSFAGVDLGFRWGPKWQRVWFRLSVGAGLQRSERTVVRFSSGTEALLFSGDTPWHGFDDNRDAAPLPPGVAHGSGSIELLIEAECMHPWGVAAFSWDSSETHRRWGSSDPGHLTLAELAERDDRVWELLCAYRFGRQLLRESPRESSLARLLLAAMDRATRVIDDSAVPTSVDEAMTALREALAAGSDAGASRVTAVGHAHIDTAWLWTLDQTRRKVQRSWANAARLCERFPAFRFLASQPYQYTMLEQDAPQLSQTIDTLVATGRWEPFGAMWVEPDASVPGLESLIRQITEGTRYFEARFGEHGRQRCVFLPDTFGFPASLPTIMRACGLDTFITNKMSWNQTNPMPSTSFIWRGIDGSEVIAHLTPGGDYNASNTPAELLRGERRAAITPPSDRWLQPFGFGDGGGGPVDWQIENASLAGACPGLPTVHHGTASEFLRELHDDAQRDRQRGRPWPVWDGELYLELHRGTLTTQARLKQLNRECELRLREAEVVLAERPADPLDDELDDLWRELLLHQFHDILPGSSIQAVNRQAVDRLSRVLARAIEIRDGRLDCGHEPAVFNPSSAHASGVIKLADDLVFVREIPPLACAPARPSQASPVSCHAGVLDNGVIRASIGQHGRIDSLVLLSTGQELAIAGLPLHTLRLYRDRPHMWDAWDIDPDYELDELDAPRATGIRPGRQHAMRSSIVAQFAIGERSSAEIEYTLDAESPMLVIDTRITWAESHRILRAEYPAAVRANTATFEIQGGVIQRPTHRNTPWDRARFEVPVHRWMDIAQPGAGLAVLNTSKYGAAAWGSTLSLSLLRSPTHPDPDADRGSHSIRTALLPHAGDWRSAGVANRAEQLNAPLLPASAPAGARAPVFTLTGSARVEVTAFKRGVDRSRRILRFVETHGGTGRLRLNAPHELRLCNAAERETGEMVPPGQPMDIRPFQILTLAF